MVGNFAVRQDQNENIMPSKKNSTSRIDGIVAAIIGLNRAMLHTPFVSIYETRGLEFI